MSRNGSGTYSLPAGNPVVSGTTISSTVHNNTLTDIATALTASIARDGQTTPSANLPMGGFRHSNVGNPTTRNQYATVDQVQDGDYVTLSAVAGTDTITASLAPSVSAYVAGMQVVLIPANSNTGAATLALNGLTALDIQKGNAAALVANDLRAGLPALLILDTGGDDWILLNPASGNLGDPTVGTLTATTVATTNLTVTNINGVAAPAAANPSVSIGLTTVNGTDTSFIRSDGAPALSQSIVPTWTAQHTYTNTRTGAGVWPILISAAAPAFGMTQTGAAANNGKWYQYVTSEQLRFAALADNELTDGIWMQVDRTGTTVDTVRFPTTTVNAFVVGTPFTGAPEPAMVQMNPAAARPALHIKNNSATVPAVWIGSDQTGGNVYVQFFDANDPETSTTGSISTNGTTTSYSTTSDATLKRDIRDAPEALDTLMRVQVRAYEFIKNGHPITWGFVAQEVVDVLPDAVTAPKSDQAKWVMDYSKLVPLMLKSIQELSQEVRLLKTELGK